MKNYLKILLILLILLTACKANTEEKEKDFYNNAILEAKIDANYQWIVIMPGLGCNGCIQEAEAFMREYVKDERILFVLTKLSSLKIFQQKTGITVSEHSNVLIDRNNLFDLHTNNGIYPCVIQLKDGKVMNHTFQNPRSAPFFHLRHQLNQN